MGIILSWEGVVGEGIPMRFDGLLVRSLIS